MNLEGKPSEGQRRAIIAKFIRDNHTVHCKTGEAAYEVGCEPHNYRHAVGWMCDGCNDHNFLFDPLGEDHRPCEPWVTEPLTDGLRP